MSVNRVSLILNGKKAGIPEIRTAVYALREQGIEIAVKVTWEAADMQRLLEESIAAGFERVIIGGGDGSLNEAVTALMYIQSQHGENPTDPISLPEIAVLPLGTANDFATSAHIPTTITEALAFAIHGQATAIDLIAANDRHFINVAAVGFGAQVTAETPTELKDFLGGGAYTLTGLAKAIGFKPYEGTIKTDKGTFSGNIVVGAICNGRQAGGGQVLAPNAKVNDGLMDVTLLKGFTPLDLPQVIEEIQQPNTEGDFCFQFQTHWLEIDFPLALPINLDGEPYPCEQVRFEVKPQAVKMVLPEKSVLLTSTNK
ncbi:lipid kinase YegS [Shewanella olleyana]|uniref:lipid kinase YegS n=1 Tax=Shewanella olleyana TaxID=135626 RepID=UPI00200D12D7|nr:lipid kinase YegS [Shewanella olleyana]MCL1068557.1 lipid kinase YegS [Shewanella olleyana]